MAAPLVVALGLIIPKFVMSPMKKRESEMCGYVGRPMPSAGELSFTSSFLCPFANPCLSPPPPDQTVFTLYSSFPILSFDS